MVIKVKHDILIYAFRYALGRMTYAPVSVMDAIKDNLSELKDDDIHLYIKEIEECENYGMEMDKKEWLVFKDFLEKELLYRYGDVNG